MTKFVKVLATSAMALSFAAVNAMAGNGMPSGAHFQFNIIGSPNGISADEKSNGRAIMIPLVNAGKNGVASLTCGGEEVTVTDDVDTGSTVDPGLQEVPKGAKINFIGSEDGYAILDRDATDSDGATIQLLTEEYTTTIDDEVYTGQVRAFDVYIRVLGKPVTCMSISGYAQEVESSGSLWYHTGTVDLNRKAGKATATSINELFDVNYCTEYSTRTKCANYSVFDDVFQGYLWNIVNNGTRNVQVRFYPKGAPVK